ncbi:MAG: ABC transporter permease subunit [Deltaproteobacteria bacterium]|nr:ABC transporter permease subunit [Deltaproteobacteria bacterium]
MNKLFDIIIWGTGALLILAFLSLFAGMLAELAQGEVVKSPDMNKIWFAVRLSLYTATIASIAAIIVSIPVAYLFSRHNFLFKNFFDTLLDLPIVLSPIALGAMLLIFFNTPVGKQINNLFGPFVFEVKGIMLAQFFVVVGLSIRLLKAAFDGIDVEYENIARTLGYGKLRVFFHVLMPLAKKGIISAMLLTWGKAMGEYGATVTLAGATTLKTETIPVAISLSFESVDITSALVFITILVVISFAILFFVRSFQGKGI